MRTRIALLCLLTSHVVSPALAQTPTPGGGRATVDYLSTQITNLQATVAALAAQVAALQGGQAPLEARVAKLESGQVDAADIVGSYQVQALGSEMQGAPARIMTESSVGTVTFHADGTLTYVGKDARVHLAQGAPWTVTYSEEDQSGTTTWFMADGKVCLGDEDECVLVGAGGRVLVGGGRGANGGWNNIFLLFRLPNP